MTVKNQDELMVLAAWMYYEDGMTHEQISARLRMSRVGVTRLLQRARREGIVQIRISKPLPLQYELERSLQRHFGLRRAIVVRSARSLEETLDKVGWAGAEYLEEVLFPKCRLGLAWSHTVRRMAPFLGRAKLRVPCTVHELAGSYLGQVNPYSVSAEVARTLGVPLESLPAPVLVQSEESLRIILSESAMSRALENARRCDIAFVGLGDSGPDCTIVQTGFLSQEQMAELRNQGAVGDILMRYYDRDGRHVPTPVEARVISLSWEDLQNLPHIVAMAAGPTKVDALVGALRGKLCHTLITDSETAEQVLGQT
jgi:DNA-binding transcriptional regulator LsrR (DeoR family)